MALQPQPQKRGAWDHCGRCGKPIVPDGLGTAIKPAMELICVARKPLSESTVAANVLQHGTGALNIDGCRVEAGDNPAKWESPRGGIWKTDSEANAALVPGDKGRWPANVIHDGSDEVVSGFPESDHARGNTSPTKRNRSEGVWADNGSQYGVGQDGETFGGDAGSAARFFYTAKADSDDRLGSRHPTVKPLDLMQYLVRLVTPPGGLVIDPFAGTGTTGEAAFREGMRAVLIEREAEYQEDIMRRMRLAMSGPDERAREAMKAKLKDKPVDHGPLFAPPLQADYDGNKDFAESLEVAYEAIRDRKAKGGPGWEPR